MNVFNDRLKIEGLWSVILGLRLGIRGEPSVCKDEAERAEISAIADPARGPKAAFYAVSAGHKPGIYTTWAEAEQQVKGFSGAKYKKFTSEAQAAAFVSGGPTPYSATNDRNDLTLSSSCASSGGVARTSSSSSGPSGSSGASRGVTGVPGSLSRARSASPLTHSAPSDLPAHLQEIARRGYTFSQPPHHLVVYTDGSGLDNGKPSARAGMGVWWGSHGEAEERGLAERVPGKLQTNNRGELLSVIRALETCPYPDLPIEIRTDSQYTIACECGAVHRNCMTTYLPKWIQNGFLTSSSSYQRGPRNSNGDWRTRLSNTPAQKVKNADMIKHLLVLLRRRGPANGVKFKYVPGHSGWEGNEEADKLARSGASMPRIPDRTDWLDPDQPDVALGANAEPVDVEVEIDESWLMTEDELAALEKDFQEE
ncbi:hypothetical protein JCM24511_00265 [Saitozyma sp. JCM 24511]|nr:hypothetical protein JCM24511_00265 [Saitozyma sp. JCM 24511]